jgi:hypothetical protein
MMLYPSKQIQAYLSANKHGFRKFCKGRMVLSFDDVVCPGSKCSTIQLDGMLDIFLHQ